MTKSDLYAFILSLLVWAAFYAVTLYSVSWLLNNEISRFYSAVPSSMGYVMSGFTVAYVAMRRMVFYGAVVGVIGSTIWLLHSGLYASPGLYHGVVIATNILLSTSGAFLVMRLIRQKEA
jgi:hypothetical protein